MKFRFDDETKRFKLYFDDEGGEQGGGEDTAGAGGEGGEDKHYTQAEVDALLKQRDEAFDAKFAKKFAEYEKKKAKEVSEAAKLAQMTEQEKADQRMAELESKLAGLEKEKTVTEMRTAARKVLQGEGLNMPDDIVNVLTADDAETTQSNVKAFVSVFKAAVQDEVKKALSKGGAPKTGSTGGTGMTKEEIMKIEDPLKRQKAIKENMALFKN